MNGPGGRRGRRTAWAAVLMVGGILAGCSGGAGPAATPIAWERIDPDPGGPGAPIAVVAWDGRFVGAGGGSTWTTIDGRTWTPTALPGTDTLSPTGIAASDELLVAGGAVNQRATTWVSEDGDAWTRLDAPALGPAPGYASTNIEAIAYGLAGFVAAGTEWGNNGQRAVAWHSEDGRTWERASTDLAGSGARALVATDAGYVLAGADIARRPEATRAMFWFSPDGLAWERAADLPSFGNGEPGSMAASGGTIVAVGYRISAGVGALAPMAWTSADGRTWQDAADTPAMSWWPLPGPTPITGEGAIQGSSMSGVAPAWGGFVAVGAHWGLNPAVPAGPDGAQVMMARSGIWRSADGSTWEVVPNDLIRVDDDTSGMIPAGLTVVMDMAGRPLVVGSEPGDNQVLWLGPEDAGGGAGG